jgi:hypothetical protein
MLPQFLNLTVPSVYRPFWDKENELNEGCVEFRLTYEGPIKAATGSDTRAAHKHAIRKQFHRQLKAYWDIHPALKDSKQHVPNEIAPNDYVSRADFLAGEFVCGNHKFVPLVTEDLSLICALDILFLRPEAPGTIIKSGDIDNRLKTLFDALRVPTHTSELGGFNSPDADENPFYCLLQDDALITHVSVTTDTLLQPINATPDRSDARLVILVKIKPFKFTWQNSGFG